MKLTIEQAKKFFHHAQRKNKVSSEFIRQHMPAMLRFMQYAITPRIVLKRKLIRKRNRIFLRHNCIRKLIFDPSRLKKRQNAKRIHSQWSKRLVTYLRRFSVVEFVEEEKMCLEAPKDVSEQLKEQLELLKSGKRIVPLFEEANISEQRENCQGALVDLATNEDCAELGYLDTVATTEIVNLEQHIPDVPQLIPLTAVDIANKELNSSTGAMIKDFIPPNKISLTDKVDKPNGNFLDMLISKVKNTTDEIISDFPKKNECNEPCPAPEKSMEPPKQSRKSSGKPAANETEERENSNSSSDFFGFDDNERVLGNCPGMLSTPLVQKRDFNSAFVSETLNAYMRDNSLESSAVVNYPQRRPEDGLVLEKSFPPKMDMPSVPEGLQGLRTVAERRAFLQKTRNTKHCIINNLGTVFRELQKRNKGQRINRQAIESVLSSNSVPMTRQGWRTSAWLLTDVGNYFFQTIDVDGENFRLYGGKGNHKNKLKMPHLSRCTKLTQICLPDCVDRITFRSLRPVRTVEKRSKLQDSAHINKPCPLSYKIIQHSQEDEVVFGSLDIVRMPKVELEVFPQLQKPLPDLAKRYLQMILPYGGISREWAEFSVSTLIERQKMEQATNPQRAFTFTLPYANERNHVIIRRLYKRSEAFEGSIDKSSLSFRKELDEMHANDETTDLLAVECADVLTDMLNSVAISCSENSFIKDDPDNIYRNDGDEEMMVEKSVKKAELNHPQHAGMSNKKQSRLLMELKRLNATIIDAATTKTEEGGSSCDKECCKLGCVCASLNEGSFIRQHCGKQRCVLDCRCKCPNVMRLETDGRTITTEDAFMLRRQATAKLARVEKEFTSTIVLTGNETLLINESQYDKKRRCTKIPKRYGDFVDPDDSDLTDYKPHKRTETPSAQNFPLEPILVKDIIYNHLKHSSVNLKKLRDVKDLAPWCMIHMVYKCFCKGQAIVGNPIVIEKQEETTEVTVVDETLATKNRALYSFDKEESKSYEESYASYESEECDSSDTSDASEFGSLLHRKEENNPNERIEKRGRISDNYVIETYMNANLNHCRRVVPIPRNIYKRRNKKRLAHVQLYIAENETDKTKLSLHEHVLRSVYFHKNPNIRNPVPIWKTEEKPKLETMIHYNSHKNKHQNFETNTSEKRSFCEDKNNKNNDEDKLLVKKRRISSSEMNDASLFHVNKYRDSLKNENRKLESSDCSRCSPFHSPSSNHSIMTAEQITIPKIANIFSLHTGVLEPMGGDAAASVAINIPQQSSEALASEQNISPDQVKSVFNVVIKNMNHMVSKKMKDIDMALRRESKAIPAPNAGILCIIRWNNFLEAYLEGFVYLWEVRTSSMTFIAATISPVMPLVVNALSVINIQALSKENLPLLGRMLFDRKKSANSESLAVVMQGQQMYWYVKGFLRPDKARICPKPTPQSHPLLTKKINILCHLLISQQVNEHKKRQDSETKTPTSSNSSSLPVSMPIIEQQSSSTVPGESNNLAANVPPQNFVPPKLKVLPMQRNISDHATAILEQMVAQAYGRVRTNVTFRKLCENEITEIFPPATMNSDHHWLVLDISNDFSHIFIPELRDLLTLDRIQKVMTYAAVKNRIVKMAFGQKSAFNAYVTPKSKRKLYFGPYKHAITAPKLVLLQSVDGQMMLREVYEARHKVSAKTFSTTAFWLIQKEGRMFLDVEDESQQAHIIEDDENPTAIQTDFATVQQNSGVEPNTKQVPTASVREDAKMQNCSSRNEPEEDDDDCIIIEDDKPTQTVALTVPSDPPQVAEPASQNRLNYTISLGGENSSLVIQNESLISNVSLTENTFTILSPNLQQPEGVLNQKSFLQKQQQPQFSTPLPINSVQNTSSLVQSGLINMSSNASSQKQNESVQPSDTVGTSDKAGTNDVSISGDHLTGESGLPLNQLNSLANDVSTLSVGSKHSALDLGAQTNASLGHLGDFSIGTIIPHKDLEPNLLNSFSLHSKQTFVKYDSGRNMKELNASHHPSGVSSSTTEPVLPESQIERALTGCDKNTEASTPTVDPNKMPSMQWNRNITIKKIPPGTESFTTKQNTYSRQSYPVTQPKALPVLSPSQRATLQKPLLAPIRPPVSVPRLQFRPRTNLPSVRPMNLPTVYPTFISHAPKIAPYTTGPRPTDPQPLTLTVRPTVSRSSTILRGQQQKNIRCPSNYSPVMRPPFNTTPRFRPPFQSGTPPSGAIKNSTVILKNPVSSASSTAITKTQLTVAYATTPISKTTTLPTKPQEPNASVSIPLQKQIVRRIIPNQTKQGEMALQNKLHRIVSSVKPPTQTLLKDPLKTTEGTANITLSSSSQPKLPNGIRKVFSAEEKVISPNISTVGGVKRNSLGTPVRPIPPAVRIQTVTVQKSSNEPVHSTQNSATNNATIRYAKDVSLPEQNPQNKGVPIELPRLKKFAIISQSNNTTIITPPTPKSTTTPPAPKEAGITSSNLLTTTVDKPTNAEQKPVKLGTIKLVGTKPTSAANTNSPDKKSPSPVNSQNTDTEYGFFHANINGLPKFVVKRIGENYLIKVPNFNGILKLTGISTVHNYLNQYTTQKCGKTPEEIVNLKWYFKPQDRSKLNIVTKSNPNTPKTDSNNVSVQKIVTAVKTPTQDPPASQATTSPANTNAKLNGNEYIVLLDDD